MTFFEFSSKFPDEKSAINYFIQIRYGGILTCPHCNAENKVYRYRQVKKLCHCKNCNNSFSPFKGTIFEKSTTDMRKWFFAIRLFLNDRKGISSLHLQREIDVTQKTAWRMLHKIREAMGDNAMRSAFTKVVEMDETYVGGKPKWYSIPSKGVDPSLLDSLDDDSPAIEPLPAVPIKAPPIIKRGRGTDKTPVVGIKERDSGRVYAQIMLPDELGNKLSGRQLLAVIEKVCIGGTTVITDDYSGYKILDKMASPKVDISILDGILEGYERYVPPPRYGHHTVCHKRKEYVAGWRDGILIHTNGIESHWALFKRGYHGTYHSMSVKYMQRYLDEFSFRQNTLKLPPLEVFDLLLKQTVFKRSSS